MPPDAPPSAVSGVSGGSSSAPEALRPVGAVRLLSAFTAEQSDPGRFYSLLARDSIALVERHTSLAGARVADVGGGAGWFTSMFRQRGAQCLLVEPDRDELFSHGEPGRVTRIISSMNPAGSRTCSSTLQEKHTSTLASPSGSQ